MARSSLRLDRLVRRAVPSLAYLTYNPLFKLAVDACDIVPRLLFPELWNLPPNHLRIRVGTNNRIFANNVSFLVWPTIFWTHFLQLGMCALDSTIVDIGCGCGRYARFLRDYRYKSHRFTGRYVGIDVDQEMLDWCRHHFDTERFAFHRSSHSSKAYRTRSVCTPTAYTMPVADNTVDFVFSASLFSHLLEHDLLNYCRESFRVLKSGGHAVMSFFSVDRPPSDYGDRHTFRFQIGNAHVESTALPEAAVAYREDFIMRTARDAGFTSAEIQAGPGDVQPILVCLK